MNYFFIEYTSSDVMPGDWEWYLDTYVVDAKSGGRSWLVDGRLESQVYEIPAGMKSHAVTVITYAPPNARKYSAKSLPAPPGVRRGILTCLRRDFFDAIGEEVFLRMGIAGILRGRQGQVVLGWVPLVLTNEIQIDPRGDDAASACMPFLDGQEIYASARFSLILREDIYNRVSKFNFKGCKTKLVVADRGYT